MYKVIQNQTWTNVENRRQSEIKVEDKQDDKFEIFFNQIKKSDKKRWYDTASLMNHAIYAPPQTVLLFVTKIIGICS